MKPAKILDTNVLLTAAGASFEAGDLCKLECQALLNRILARDVVVVIDNADEVLREYRNKLYPHFRGNIAERFLFFLLQNSFDRNAVARMNLQRDAMGRFEDYPDSKGMWSTPGPRCKQFDEDDKKWVALAVRFKADTGADAPIVNAGDRCWRAFETHLSAAGLLLDFLCANATNPTPTDAPG